MTMDGPEEADTLVILPCYNEAERLDRLALLQLVWRSAAIRLLLVDDGSRDATPRLIRELCRAEPQRISGCFLERNCGKAEAVRQGVLRAKECRPRFVGYWDADLATPLEAIADFRAVLLRRPQVELVMGSRLPLLGHRIRRDPLRGALGGLFATIASRALGLAVRDTQCGAKLFRATESTYACFAEPFLAKWIFDVELLARMRADSTGPSNAWPERVYEFPLEAWRDVPGSKLRPRHFIQAARELLGIYWRYAWKSPSRRSLGWPKEAPNDPVTSPDFPPSPETFDQIRSAQAAVDLREPHEPDRRAAA